MVVVVVVVSAAMDIEAHTTPGKNAKHKNRIIFFIFNFPTGKAHHTNLLYDRLPA